MIDNKLPVEEKAEEALVASLLIDPSIIEEYANYYDINEVYTNKLRTILKSVIELALGGEKVDLITVKNKLEEKDKLDSIGGIEYLVEITANLPTSANWESYAKIVQNNYKRRELIKEARRIELGAFNLEVDLGNIVDQAYTNINKALLSGTINTVTFNEIKNKIEKHIEENKTSGLLGWDWGIPFLNKNTGGIRKGKSYRIAGNSGVGKTNLFYQIIPNLLKQNAKVIFISLENSVESTYIKIMSSVMKKNPIAIERGQYSFDFDWLEKYKDNLIITDQIFEWGEIKREIQKVNPDIVLLDYLQNVEVKGVFKSLEKLDFYASEVKKFILKNQHISWIDISQLSIGADEKETKRNGNFKGSGELKSAVDFGLHLFLYQPFLEHKEEVLNISENPQYNEEIKNRSVVSMTVTKNRLGPTGGFSVQGINFNEGITYKEVPKEVRDSWG